MSSLRVSLGLDKVKSALNKPKSAVAKVSSLIGEREVHVDADTNGKQLLDRVAEAYRMGSTRFLGLEYVSADGEREYLDPARRVLSATQNPGLHVSEAGWTALALRFRIFPADVDAELGSDDNAMELLYKQVHADISQRSNRVAVPDRTRAELQRLYEGYNVPEYLRLAQTLTGYYGVHSFEITNSAGLELLLQVRFDGLDIVPLTPDRESSRRHFTPTGAPVPWRKIDRVAYNRRTVTISFLNIEGTPEMRVTTRRDSDSRKVIYLVQANGQLHAERVRKGILKQ